MFGWAATWVNRWHQSSSESNRLLARWLPCKQFVLQFYTIICCLADCTVHESNPAPLYLWFPLFWKQKIFFGSIWERSDTSTSTHSFHSAAPTILFLACKISQLLIHSVVCMQYCSFWGASQNRGLILQEAAKLSVSLQVAATTKACIKKSFAASSNGSLISTGSPGRIPAVALKFHSKL